MPTITCWVVIFSDYVRVVFDKSLLLRSRRIIYLYRRGMTMLFASTLAGQLASRHFKRGHPDYTDLRILFISHLIYMKYQNTLAYQLSVPV